MTDRSCLPRTARVVLCRPRGGPPRPRSRPVEVVRICGYVVPVARLIKFRYTCDAHPTRVPSVGRLTHG